MGKAALLSNRKTGVRARLWMWVIALVVCFVPGSSSAQVKSVRVKAFSKKTIYRPVPIHFASSYVRGTRHLKQPHIDIPDINLLDIHTHERMKAMTGLVNPKVGTGTQVTSKTKKAAGRREAAIQPIELNIEGIYAKLAPYTNETLKRLHIDPNVPELEVTPRNPVFTHPSGSPTLPFSEKMQQHSRANADTKEKIAEFYSSIGEVLQDETKIKSIRQHMKNFQHFLMLEELKFIDLKLKDKIKRNRHRINSQDTDFVLKAYILIYDDYDEYFRHTAA